MPRMAAQLSFTLTDYSLNTFIKGYLNVTRLIHLDRRFFSLKIIIVPGFPESLV